MKRLITILILLLVAMLVIPTTISCSKSESTQTTKAVVLRLASSYPIGDPQEYMPVEMAKRFNERAGGKYVIEVHAAQTLVHIAEGLDAVRTGTVEMALFPTGPCAAADARFAVIETPFLYNSIQADAEAWKDLKPLYAPILEEKFNQKVLYGVAGGSCEIISKKPIKSLDDIKGVLTQSLSPPLATFLELMGASPVALAGDETYSGLQKGVIDAALTPPDAMKAFGMWEVAEYVTFGYFAPSADFCNINLDIWKAMPKDIQDLLVEEMTQLQNDVQNIRVKAWDENPGLFESKGMECFKLNKSDRDKWQAKSDPVFEKSIDELGDFGKQLKAIADKVNAKYPY